MPPRTLLRERTHQVSIAFSPRLHRLMPHQLQTCGQACCVGCSTLTRTGRSAKPSSVACTLASQSTSAVSQHCHEHGRLPPWAPYDELQQPYNQPSFPHVLPYVCDKCVTGFIEEADSFLPCDRCMHFEQMVCDAGSAFPSVSLPGYLLDRVNLSEHEQ